MHKSDNNYIVEMKNITKTFGEVVANNNINFSVFNGEIRALLGENGAGKTTLMNILYGLIAQDSGSIIIKGNKVKIKSPNDSINLGIGMIHQRPLVVKRLSVIDNIMLGSNDIGYLNRVNYTKARKKLENFIEKYNFKIELDREMWTLSEAEWQRVAILNTLYYGADLLILDEPTSVLTPKECDMLFDILKKMIAENKSIIYITHKLEEVISIADNATVLRDGQKVGSVEVEKTTTNELAKMMVGREVLFNINNKNKNTLSERDYQFLQVDSISINDEFGQNAVKDVSFSVNKGEIFGVAGISGSGQKQLAEVLGGLKKPEKGELYIDGNIITRFSAYHFIKEGIGYLPENLFKQGVAAGACVKDNAILKQYVCNPEFKKGPFINETRVREYVEGIIDDYEVKVPGLEEEVLSLSGGNLQKLVLGRELSRDLKILIAAQPTKGLDVSATEYVYNQLIKQRDEGCAIVLISDDLDEIMELSDKIGVMFSGGMISILSRKEANKEKIGKLMGGVQK